MIKNAERVIFSLLIFFSSFQVGLHFWPKFSYVSGVRVDYLSPTLYWLDILILLFILVSIPSFVKNTVSIYKDRTFRALLVVFILDLILNLFLSKSWEAHFFGIIKLTEFILLGISIANFFKINYLPLFTRVFCFSAVLSSSLAIWQFIKQSSIGGFLYFVGERSFGISTIGISTVNLDQQILRPYAAFPHPNVLAFFLLFAIVFATQRLKSKTTNYEKMFLIFAIVVSSIALFLTFSRTSIALLISFLFYEIYTKRKRNVSLIVVSLASLVVLSFLLFKALPWEFLTRGIDFREELFVQSLTILKNSPYFGIGLNNFFIYQDQLIKTISPINYQPVHNIFAYSLLSLGLLAFWIVPYFFYISIRSLLNKIRSSSKDVKNFYQAVLFLVISIIFVGMFDHFFLSLEQGQLMLALILGLSFTKLRS